VSALELGEFVAVGIDLALGALGLGPQVGTQVVAVACGRVRPWRRKLTSIFSASAQTRLVSALAASAAHLTAGGVFLH
jgi:hypothetical protein